MIRAELQPGALFALMWVCHSQSEHGVFAQMSMHAEHDPGMATRIRVTIAMESSVLSELIDVANEGPVPLKAAGPIVALAAR